MSSRTLLKTLLALLALVGAVIPVPALAQSRPDPRSPAGQEYQLPLDQARGQGNPGGGSDGSRPQGSGGGGSGSGSSDSRFGAGVTDGSKGGGGGDKKPPPPSAAERLAAQSGAPLGGARGALDTAGARRAARRAVARRRARISARSRARARAGRRARSHDKRPPPPSAKNSSGTSGTLKTGGIALGVLLFGAALAMLFKWSARRPQP